MSVRNRSAAIVPLGESDGRWIALPDESFDWVSWRRARLAWRLARVAVDKDRCVIR
jgi:hypothetical protein